MNSSLSKKSFGALIRKFRLKNGYTQQHLALKIGIQTKSISFIERGINYPSPENIFKLAQVLNISLDEYIFGYCKFDPTINNDEINYLYPPRTTVPRAPLKWLSNKCVFHVVL